MANACSLELECDAQFIIASRHGIPIGCRCSESSYIAVIGIEDVIYFKENFCIINRLVVHGEIPNAVILVFGRDSTSKTLSSFSSQDGTSIEAGIKCIMHIGDTEI